MYMLLSNLFWELLLEMADVSSLTQEVRWVLCKSNKANGYRVSPESVSEVFSATCSKDRKVNREY